jgi:hypothetical protein
VVWANNMSLIVRSEPFLEGLERVGSHGDRRVSGGVFIKNPDNSFTLIFHELDNDESDNRNILLIKTAFD